MTPPGQTTNRKMCRGRREGDGERCGSWSLKDSDYCKLHQDQARNPWKRLRLWLKWLLSHYWPIAAAIALISLGLSAVQAYNALTGKPFLDLLRRSTPTAGPVLVAAPTHPPALAPSATAAATVPAVPTPTPFTTRAAEGEYLIIVAQFEDDSEARNLAVSTVLAEGITAALPDVPAVRVFAAHSLVISGEAQAQAIGAEYRATTILWGRYTDNLIEVNLTPLVELLIPPERQELRVIDENVDELAVFVNDLAAGSVRWLSLMTIGQALYLADRHQEGIAYLDAAVEQAASADSGSDEYADIHFYRGNVWVLIDEYRRAVADYDTAIDLHPGDAGYYNNRGFARFKLGDLKGAVSDLERAIQLDPQDATAYSNLGMARFGQGDLAGAAADMSTAVTLDPQEASAYNNRCLVRKEQQDLEGAIADCTRAIEIEPEADAAYNNRGLAREAQGDLAGALADFNRAVEIDPNKSVTHFNRGNVRYAQHDVAGAMADFDRAIELDPEAERAYNNRGLARQAQGDLAGAIADYTRAIELTPRNAVVFGNRGTAYHDQNDLALALADYDRALELDPKDGVTYCHRGMAYEDRLDYERALADFRTCLQLATDPLVREQAETHIANLEKAVAPMR